jgi:hypothetical protein
MQYGVSRQNDGAASIQAMTDNVLARDISPVALLSATFDSVAAVQPAIKYSPFRSILVGGPTKQGDMQ